MKNLLLHPPRLIYEKFIAKQREGATFAVMFFFLVTFIVSRAYVYSMIEWNFPEIITRTSVKGVHVHHFTWGILINSIVGYLMLILPRDVFEEWKIKLASFFGVGLGLTFDEFGMWLLLQDEYWVRHSYDAVIVITLIFINIIYLGNMWKRLFTFIMKIELLRKRFGKKVNEMNDEEIERASQ